jgi:hypothetical protein
VQDEAVTATRLLLAAATTAAAAAGIVPAVHNGSAQASGPLTVGDASSTTTIVVPQSAKLLTGQTAGSRAVAAHTRLTVVRSTDGATLFTGSLATFTSLAVAPGTKLQVRVERPAAYAGLKADATLAWS